METLDTIHATPYTLTELCALIGEALDECLAPSYWVKAEISSLSIKGGHMYLELIDNQTTSNNGKQRQTTANIASKMRATCWSGTQELLTAYFESETGQVLQPGMTVLVETEVQYHPVYGLSLSITNIDPSFTVGQIAQQRQRTIAQLQKDGLLDAQQLLPLPTLIHRIAVISSPNAAGYEDFVNTLHHTPYTFRCTLFPATMQGEHAAKSIIAALDEISNQNSAISCQNNLNAEGSWLTALDEISNSEAVLQSEGLKPSNPQTQSEGLKPSNPQTQSEGLKPSNPQTYDIVVIIRGGGATTDLSCFDDYELCAVCAQMDIPVITGIGHTRDVSVLDLVAHESLKTPTAVAEWLIHRMDAQAERIDTLRLRLQRTAERQILIRRHKIELLEQRLAACNPERIYRLGYSLLTKNGKVIRSVKELSPGDIVTTHLQDGSIESITT